MSTRSGTPNHLVSEKQDSQLTSLIMPATILPALSSFSTPSSLLLLKMENSADLSSLINTSGSSFLSSETFSHSLFQNHSQELSQTNPFLFDHWSNKGPDHFLSPSSSNPQSSQLPPTKLPQTNFDPSQSDVILHLKMKAGWTRGLRKKSLSEAEIVMAQISGETQRVKAKSDGTSDCDGEQDATLDANELLEELLKESGRLEFARMGSETQNWLDSQKQNQLAEHDNSNSLQTSGDSCFQAQPSEDSHFYILIYFNDYSCTQFCLTCAGESLGEVHENTVFTNEEFPELFCFDPSSLAVPILYDENEILNGQSSSVPLDYSFNHGLHQTAFNFPLPSGKDYGLITETCSLDYLS